MINKIISFSVRNKFIISLFVLTLIGVGIYSMLTINLGSVPDITNNQVQVITVSENLGTEDIEQFVTYPVELAMGNLPGVTEIRSISRFGLSVVTIVFEDDMGTYLPRQLVQEKLNELGETIPDKFGSPEMGPISSGLGQIYEYSIKVDPEYESEYTPNELRTIQDWIIKRQMVMLEGVVEVNSFGGGIKQYEVSLNPEKLNAMGITISEVYEALAKNNTNTGGAYIEKNRMANFIRGEGLIRTLDDIRSIVIKNEGGLPITINDVVAEVKFGTQTRYGAFTQDGEEAVGGIIMMLKGSNPNATVNRVRDRIAEIQNSLPEGLHIEPIIDRSELIGRTTSTVSKNLIEGALIVVFVLVLLLGSLRGGLITASLIPLSLLFAFILMKATGVWANLMSLGAIDFGIIVDGAVIIVEGIVHEIQKRVKSGKSTFNKVQMDEISYKASSTMMNAAFFGQLIILIVFTPILFLEGVEGKMFRPMAFTFGFAVLGAIILCLTYVPMISAVVMRPSNNTSNWFVRIEGALDRFSNKIIEHIQRVYRPVIIQSLNRKALVIGLAVILFAAAIFTFSRMGGEFIPQLDEGDIAMQALIRPGSGLTESIEVSKKIERILLNEFPEVETVTARIGVADIPTDPMPFDIADMYVILNKDKDSWVSADSKDELIDKIKATLDESLVGVNLVFTQPVELRFNELLEGVREDIAVKLYGEDLEILSQKVNEMASIIQTVPGVGDVSAERISGLPQMTVQYNRDKVAQYGLTIEKLNEYVSTAFAGGVAGVVFEGEKRFDLVVRFDETFRTGIEDLQNLYIDLENGTQVPIKEVADISYQPGPMQISRDNTFRRTYVGVNARGRDVESLVSEIQDRLDAELSLPPGYYITYGGEFENLQRAKSRLGIVVPIALFLIFVLLYFALNSFAQSAMIYLAIPLAAIGGVFFLELRGMSFSISAGVGFIVLFGVAVLNGLVLISRFNSLKEEGVADLKERILAGTQERLRPILLTATAAIMGFTPMAFSASAGAEVQRPLATVVIGGLISATLLSLIILPVLYAIEEKWQEKRRNRKAVTVSSILVILGSSFLLSGNLQAQELNTQSLIPLTVEQAVSKALENYPAIKAAELSIESERALKKSAWDFGDTGIFTGKEEVGNGSDGINTRFGISQEFDLFRIPSRINLQRAKQQLAEDNLELAKAQIQLQVQRSWAEVYTALHKFELLDKLYAQYSEITRAAELRLETEASSKLEYLSLVNQANDLKIKTDQARQDYRAAMSAFNQWFGGDSLYTTEALSRELLDIPVSQFDSSGTHPFLMKAEQNIEVSEAESKSTKSAFLPRLEASYSAQEISGQTGFYSYEVGIRVPLFFWSQLGKTQSSQIQTKITRNQFEEAERTFWSMYSQAKENYIKWNNSWSYYKREALPLAEEQQSAAITAYQEGAVDYIMFLQNLRDALNIELKAWDAFGDLLDSRYILQYYSQSSRN
ncbi:MAG: CusA/CzcA family heavy metal efflux RND transporter [bacterium]|nr:CusA/CzcA family heavy metal efflux RND transporter [bacterium]